jgi:hypothetical protein
MKNKLHLFKWVPFVVLFGCSGGGNNTTAQPPTVEVSVQATDPTGNKLTYEWRATEGTIANINSPQTTWTLPAGPGLHFAYVLISNGKGGYTERRVAVSTDDIGVPAVAMPPVVFDAPTAPPPTGSFFQSVLKGGGSYGPMNSGGTRNGIYLPDIFVYLQNTITGVKTATVQTDVRGYYTVPNVAPGAFSSFCSNTSSGLFSECFGAVNTIGTEAYSNYFSGWFPDQVGDVFGRVVLADGSPCGIVNEYLGKVITAQATLLDSNNAVIAGPLRANRWGHYRLPGLPDSRYVRVECEGAAPVITDVIPFDANEFATVLVDSAPVVSSMSASLNGAEVGISATAHGITLG